MRPRFWHPFADMSTVARDGSFIIERGDGVYVYDDRTRRYLDATASLWYCNVGYGRDEITQAAADQMRRIPAYSTFGDFANRPVLDLAERVSSLAPVPDSAVFLTSGGSDAIDSAIKLSRRYWELRGQPQRTLVIGRSGSYHGMHLGGTTLAGIPTNKEGYGQPFEGALHVAWDSADALARTIEEAGPERVAAFFIEPVVGAGGVFHPPPGYLEQVRRICRDTGVLLVADEVVTGFGRLGDWFASVRYELEPDLLVCAKGITSGYLPLGGLIVAPWIAEPFYDGSAGMWRHGYTYSGHATVAAAALANLDIIEREDLIGHARRLEPTFAETLGALADHELVDEVRVGDGLLAAVQIDPSAIADDPRLPARVIGAARGAGVLTRTLATGAIHVSPPLIIQPEQLQELAGGLRQALDHCLSERTAAGQPVAT